MNRFSEELLQLEPLTEEHGYIMWMDLYKVLPNRIRLTPHWFYDDEMAIPYMKLQFICLLAAMSDEDLLECFGV